MNDEIKQDVISAAKVIYDQLSTHDRIEFINSIRGVKKLTITSGAITIGTEAINHKWVNTND